MSILKKPNHRWLPLALVPLFSMSVLVGCGSDDDDDALVVAPEEVVDPAVIAGDADGSGIADAFETLDAEADANGNGIADVYEVPAPGAPTEAADVNENSIDDSYEIAYSNGLDADADGVDDAAAIALANGGAPGPDGGEETPDTGEETPDTGEETPDTGEETPDTGTPVERTGNLDLVTINGGVGTADLNWDGSNLTGQVDVAEGVTVNSVAIYTGIGAAGNGSQAIVLEGSNPTFTIPNLGTDQAALIRQHIENGNLYLRAELSDGSTQPGSIFLSTIQAKYVALNGANSVPATEALSSGAGHLNINSETGGFTAAVQFSAVGDEVITAAHIHLGAATDEDGPVIVDLLQSADGATWEATGQLSTADLASVLDGNTFFNVHGEGGAGIIRGQIQ